MNQPSAAADRWLRRFKQNPAARVRLVCFPHAGGSASFYFPLALAHAGQADVVVLQYPGRQERRREPLIRDVDAYVRQIAPILAAEPPLPTVYFGHSMGAILAFETALANGSGPAAPAALVVSGRRAPSTVRDERVHERTDDGILAELRQLNGTRSDLLGDEEIVRMTMPSIRSDYRVIETYPARPDLWVDCPITALLGDDDPKCTVAEAERWSEHTTGEFRLRTFPGGHFFLADHQAAVNDELANALRTAGVTAART